MAGPSLAGMIQALMRDTQVELPSFKKTSLEIMRASEDPDCSLQDYAAIIRKAPIIAAKVIRVANSSFYRGLHTISSLPDAIRRLGFNGVRNIALAIGMKDVYECSLPRHQQMMERLWVSSISSAVVCLEIARMVPDAKEEEAFLAGLVHDIGSVFIISALDLMATSDERIAQLSEDLLEELHSTLHEAMGAELLQQWNFPTPISEAVRVHHRPSDAEDVKVLAWVISAAEMVERKLGLGGSPPEEDLKLVSTPAFQALRLDDMAAARLLVDLEDKTLEVRAAVG